MTRPLARKHRKHRDDRKFVVATEDTYAPEQYLKAFRLTRVAVEVVPTPVGEASAAMRVVARLKDVHEVARRNGDLIEGDQFWVFLDTDHWTRGTHLPQFLRALKEARDAGFHVAVSNPCFDLWLLLHLRDAPDPCSAATVLQALKVSCGEFNKNNIRPHQFLPTVEQAIARARSLDVGAGGWPQETGTQVFLLIEQLLAFRDS